MASCYGKVGKYQEEPIKKKCFWKKTGTTGQGPQQWQGGGSNSRQVVSRLEHYEINTNNNIDFCLIVFSVIF